MNFEFPDKLKINGCKSIHEYKRKIKKVAFLIKYRADTADKVKKGMCFLKACLFGYYAESI